MGRISLYFTVALLLLGCKESAVPSSYEKSIKSTIVKGGTVQMFDDTNFSIKIPELIVQQYEVSNLNFEKFIQATKYITTAEKNNEGMVFDKKEKKWVLKKGANWKHPQGPESNIENKDFYPVVHVSYEDACAYCDWMDMRLPYESEWEYIFKKDSEKPAPIFNHWQGIFPIEDKGTDGYTTTSPVGTFGNGASGCYDLQGNVWEWCNDFYHEQWPSIGKEMNDSIKYTGPTFSFSENSMYDTLHVIKGGSFLCADNYCKGYINQIRMGADSKLGYEHIGFRCVKKK